MKKMLQVRLELSEWQELAIRAVKENVSITDYVRKKLILPVQEQPKPFPPPIEPLLRTAEVDVPAVIPVKKSVLSRGVVAQAQPVPAMASAPAPVPQGMTVSEVSPPNGYGGSSTEMQH